MKKAIRFFPDEQDSRKRLENLDFIKEVVGTVDVKGEGPFYQLSSLGRQFYDKCSEKINQTMIDTYYDLI